MRLLLSKALDIYLKTSGFSLLWICSISVILFTVISLLLVNGFNEKTYAAIVATLLGTFFSLVITYLVMVVTSERGLRYEEMQFVTSPYRMVFMAGLFVGALGAVMDVAITMSSSLFGLYEKNNDISIKALKDFRDGNRQRHYGNHDKYFVFCLYQWFHSYADFIF